MQDGLQLWTAAGENSGRQLSRQQDAQSRLIEHMASEIVAQ